MPIRFEKCTLAHLEALVQVSKATFIDAFEAQNDPKDFKSYMEAAFSTVKIREELTHPDASFFFVYDGETLLGYVKWNENDTQTDIKDKTALEIERLYVLKEHQGKKIGHHILQKIKALAIKKRKRYIWLGVWENNTAAIAFYLREGFVKVGTHPYFIGADEQTDWLMRYDLLTLEHAKNTSDEF